MSIKQKLFKQCLEFVNNRANTIEDIISSNQRALQTETKSSAGDKHETGRAMLQLEMEKASQQLSGVYKMKAVLSKINPNKKSEIVHLGSIVETNFENYFLSISAGELNAENKTFYAISVSSPIGRLLLGKTINKKIIFNGKEMIIKKIK
ncbi:3-oxoacyl-ACP synthase [Polaribacter ponticola]|uniref:3-oxoacyl-ACP synthase n=1 Tax=Polaribacter ponticola TaxID=2978475 RepID=A0ABT5SBK7_9FLAO|nr:3-oxoacyl-ACP synthase [Polaribacter sp. MSW5]MDD7915505.1 3-oxoacyl-ACP synthase [Polaribacter sp. MSW5]